MALMLVCVGCLLAVGAVGAEPPEWVMVQEGRLPLVITAPHGGYHEPPNWPVRTPVGDKIQFNLQDDLYTQELAQELAAALQAQLGQPPWLVAGQVRRRYLDFNRPPELAYTDAVAAPAWLAYHGAIARALQATTAQAAHTLLLDIHGHGRQAQRPPLYLGTQDGRTWQALVQKCGIVCTWGPEGLHAQLQALGYSVPAVVPQSLNGGYTVRHYSQMPGVSAIQVEVPRVLRADPSSRLQFARDLAHAVVGLVSSD